MKHISEAARPIIDEVMERRIHKAARRMTEAGTVAASELRETGKRIAELMSEDRPRSFRVRLHSVTPHLRTMQRCPTIHKDAAEALRVPMEELWVEGTWNDFGPVYTFKRRPEEWK